MTGILREACQRSRTCARGRVGLPGVQCAIVNLDGLRRAAGIEGQHGSSDVFRVVPEQEFDGVRNVLDARQISPA